MTIEAKVILKTGILRANEPCLESPYQSLFRKKFSSLMKNIY